MKRNLYLMLIIGLVLPPSFCGASYLIEFKSGSKFVTSHYWTTGNQVHFYSHGGVMGVTKFSEEYGFPILVDRVRIGAEEITPPCGMKTMDWVKSIKS